MIWKNWMLRLRRRLRQKGSMLECCLCRTGPNPVLPKRPRWACAARLAIPLNFDAVAGVQRSDASI
eukprot:14433932-Heterocapsa_arctica.AAC.1